MSLNFTDIVLKSSDLLSNYPARCKPSIWLQLALTPFLGMIVHYFMLQRCPTGIGDMSHSKMPPWVSLVGCLCEASFKSPMEFVRSARALFWQPQPVRMRIFGTDICVVQGGPNIAAMLKENSLSAIPLAAYLLQKAFRLPPRVVRLHYDESRHVEDGLAPMYNKVREINRRFLAGREGKAFMDRFQNGLRAHIQALEQRMTPSWIHWEDFTAFFRKDLMTVVLNALCGENLLQLSPEFLVDFWEFNDNLTSFLTLNSRLFGSRKHDARDSALLAIERWQTVAARSFDSKMIDSSGADPGWGSAFFRERYAMMQELEGYDAKAMASQELSFLFALNSNAITATFWTSLEVFKDAELLRTIRIEVGSCAIPGKTMEFDMQALLHRPMLQAVYAETLRLRGHGLFVRKAQNDVNIHGWTLPKHSLVLASSTPAHMDPDVWCPDGAGPSPPVDVFWPGRFLRSNGGALEFNSKATEGSWLPFGGGINPCPGRQFAKLQAFLTVALLVSTIDCAVLADELNLKMSMKNFSIGILSPVSKVPVRVRSRCATW